MVSFQYLFESAECHMAGHKEPGERVPDHWISHQEGPMAECSNSVALKNTDLIITTSAFNFCLSCQFFLELF